MVTTSEKKKILIDCLNDYKRQLDGIKAMIIYFVDDKQMMKNIRIEYDVLIAKIHKLQKDINALN